MPTGFLILDKPSGPTSHDMVNLVRRGTGERRAGHAGTLDPLATGVLVICLGSATRLSEYLLGESKRYQATARLGVSTTTYDAQGEVTATSPVRVERAGVEAALESFRGKQLQTPPAYSAVKRGGVKAYDLARRGQAVTLEAREVTLYDLRLTAWQPPDALLDIHCSAGTYVRSLAHDLGLTLGCGAHLAALRRTASGHFDLSTAVTEAALKAAVADGAWQRHLLPVQAGLPHWPQVQVEAAAAQRLANGQAVASGEWRGPGGVGREAEDEKLRNGALALAFDVDGRLVAVVERDEQANAWRPKKVMHK